MVKKQLQLLNKFQMLDIFNHCYRTCFVANPANKNALMAPWMSPAADSSCCSWRNSRELTVGFLRCNFFSSVSEIYR